MHFHFHGAGRVGGGIHADAECAVRNRRCLAGFHSLHAHGIDAERREHLGHSVEVARRKANRSTEALTGDHHAGQAVGSPERRFDVVEIAPSDGIADARARPSPFGVASQWLEARVEAEALPETEEIVEPASASFPESEVLSNDDGLCTEIAARGSRRTAREIAERTLGRSVARRSRSSGRKQQRGARASETA